MKIDLNSKLDAARNLRGLILQHRDGIDAERKLPDSVLQAMADFGMFKSMVPKSAGGEEWDLPTWVRVVEELSTVDGSVGWIAGVGGAVNAITTGWLADEVGQEIISSGQFGILAGAGRPVGNARPVDGGFIVSGRWQFASSSPHAGYFLGGYHLDGVIVPATGPMMFFPAADVEIIDTWHVGGMRGTGSHDFSVNEVFVPSTRAINAEDDPPAHEGPLYRIPMRLTLGAGLAPLCLGMARGAIDCFVRSMESKPDRPPGTLMKDRLTLQERVAKAEALVRSARAFLYEAVEEMWDIIKSQGQLDERQTAMYRLASMHGVASGAQAIDIVYRTAGTSSIFTSNLLERFFRDVHVATQHRSGTPEDLYQVGAVILGASTSD